MDACGMDRDRTHRNEDYDEPALACNNWPRYPWQAVYSDMVNPPKLENTTALLWCWGQK